MDNIHEHTISAAIAKAAPPTIVTGATMFFGVTLNELVAIATIVYVVLQTFFLLFDRYKLWRKERKKDD